MNCDRRIAASRGRYPYHEGKHLIVVLERFAYGDESGTETNAFCTVAGFIASPRQWQLLKKAWRAVLDGEAVTTFHAEKFFQRANWRSSKSPYHGWTPDRADNFIAELLNVVLDRSIKPIGGPVNVADFEAMHPDMRKVITGATLKWRWSSVPGSRADPSVRADFRTSGAPQYPYFAAFNLFIDEALTRTPQGAKVHFVLDRHGVYEGYARVVYAERLKLRAPGWEKMGHLRYAASSDHEALQVADLYAYILNGWITRNGKVSRDRFEAAQAFFRKRNRIRVQNTASFEKMLAEIDAEVMNAITADLLR